MAAGRRSRVGSAHGSPRHTRRSGVPPGGARVHRAEPPGQLEDPRRPAVRGRRPRMEPQARRGRLRRAHLAEGVRRGGRPVQPPGDLPRGAGARRGAVAPRRDRARHGRPDDHRASAPTSRRSATSRRSSPPKRSGARASPSPTPGSDLAAVRTRIEDTGDHFLVNGQKVWSSFAHIADFCILVGRRAARRAALPEPHLRDRRHARARRRGAPARADHGQPEFNEIFFTDVKVPKENLLGEVGGGWQVAMTTLLHERGTLGFALSATLDVAVRKLIALARERDVTIRSCSTGSRASGSSCRHSSTRTTAR